MPFENNFDPWAQGIRGIGTILAQRPQLNAMAADRAARAALMQAQMQTEAAQSRKYGAEATGQEQVNTAGKAVLDVFSDPSNIQTNSDGGITITPKGIAAMLAKSGLGTGSDFKNVVAAVNADATQKRNLESKERSARDVAGIRAQSMEDIARETPWNIPQGTKAVDRTSGELIGRGDVTLGEGDVRVLGEDMGFGTLAAAAAQGRDPQPKSAQGDVERMRMLREDLNREKNALAKAEEGEIGLAGDRTVNTNRVNTLAQRIAELQGRFDQMTTNATPTAVPPKTGQPDASAPGQPKVSGRAADGEPLVKVFNPRGEPKKIRQSQLADALASGYKLQ